MFIDCIDKHAEVTLCAIPPRLPKAQTHLYSKLISNQSFKTGDIFILLACLKYNTVCRNIYGYFWLQNLKVVLSCKPNHTSKTNQRVTSWKVAAWLSVDFHGLNVTKNCDKTLKCSFCLENNFQFLWHNH